MNTTSLSPKIELNPVSALLIWANVTFNSISVFVGVLSGVVIGESQRHAG